ncbi:ImmA/IrrE family metallo-endopeptidase [Geomesophilobacter sediminis]|uniref:Uncharacterized protein n=1 Tax=Geomesophilobacter sediminis TaxID=2798584 RepID=A0A8J7LWX1_9BACT|nr:hypothetical protein [Geomesophilobacter sediminis]MBJ6726355.1 hypothetical protein [Geomesophilobacter sediminis]
MKIEFDKIISPYSYPFSAAEVKQVLAECVPPDILATLSKVHFGCKQRTTQEARIVGRGSSFEIRINFCPKDGKTNLLSDKREWREIVELCGGRADSKARTVMWTLLAAKKYAAFLIAHEVGHVAYAHRNGFGGINGRKSSPSEESWCDAFARTFLQRL